MTPRSTANPNRFAAQLLERGAAAFAHDAASDLAARRPDLASQFGTNAVTTWRELIAAQIHELATALDYQRPDDFAHQVAWARIAFGSRAFPIDYLRESLDSMRNVVQLRLADLPANQLAPYFAAAETVLGSDESQVSATAPTSVHPVLNGYLKHLLDGDRRAATRTLVDAVRSGQIDIHAAYVDVCLAAQREIGCLWHRNEISIAVEHFVTATAQSTMAELFALGTPSASHGKSLLAASVAGDRHDIGLRCTTDLLALDGWKTIYLGADVPVNDIVSGIDEYGVDLVLLSATLGIHRKGVADAIARIRDAASDRTIPVLVGGAAFDGGADVSRAVGADGHASNPRHAMSVARSLAGLPPA